MFSKRRWSSIILFVFMLCCYSYTIFGQDYSFIKVGLESVYNNAKSISISSDGALTLGHYNESGFMQVGTLKTNTITIEKATTEFRNPGGIYTSFDEANTAANSLGGIPVYFDQGVYGVYTTNQTTGSAVVPSSTRYVAKDTNGNIILVFNKGTNDLVFRGYDAKTGMYLTKVGSTKKYRGAIGIAGTTGITPYNILDMEQYLYGVIPGEMPASWPTEALKAQAVAARSIAIYQYNRFASRGYNVVDTTTTQVYGGYSKEDSRTNAAVDMTKGETIKYNGKVAEAVYFSTSGGMTEAAVNVWGSNISYLVGVSDIYETEPEQAAWTRNITLSDLNTCLAKQGINIGSAQGVQIVSRTNSGRVKELKILGTTGSYSLTLEKIRTFFSSINGGSLKSRLFTFNSNGIGGGSQGASSNEQVTVLSADGMSKVNVSDLAITNGYSTQKAPKEVTVLSAYGKTTLTSSTNSSGNLQDSETVWGDFTIYGEGFGHGVGMSQSGARGMAKAGYDYVDILTHYYTGITVGK